MDVVPKFVLFSFLIITLPPLAYFVAARGAFDGPLELVFGAQYLQDNKTVISGGLAIALVNMVSALYVILAFNEAPPPPAKKEQ